jgi:hypothetical protein
MMDMKKQAHSICDVLLEKQARASLIDLLLLRQCAEAEALRQIIADLKDGLDVHAAAAASIRKQAETLADDPLGNVRNDLAPVWQTSDPRRIHRLRRMVEELEYYPAAQGVGGFTAMLHEGRYVELVEALLSWLCEQARQQQSEFDSSVAVQREYRQYPQALKRLGEYASPEALDAVIKSAEMKVDYEAGPLYWAKYHPLVSHRVGGKDYEPTAGRNPEWIKRNLGEALMCVLLVAGYDKGQRDSWGRVAILNKRTAANRSKRIASKFGFALSVDALEKVRLLYP